MAYLKIHFLFLPHLKFLSKEEEWAIFSSALMFNNIMAQEIIIGTFYEKYK
jgi:hypothetical protein